jgi:hypothetical protein
MTNTLVLIMATLAIAIAIASLVTAHSKEN